MPLSRFARIRLGHFPTPLEPMPRLSALLDGPKIWIKRDDCTGLSTGGNKTRKLEFLMAEAVAIGADIVLTQNHPIQRCPPDSGSCGETGDGLPSDP